MRPAERRIRRQQIDSAKASLQRWKDAVAKFKPGTLPHSRASEEVNKAQYRLDALKDDFK